MAQKSLFKISILQTAFNPPYVAGDEIIVYWDTDSSDFVVTLNGTQVYSGVTLGVEDGVSNSGVAYKRYSVSIFPANATVYQFCNGGDLNYFEFSKVFPYAIRRVEVDSTLCNTNIVCDVNFEGTPIIVKASTPTSADGEITVLATSSNGTVRYSLQDEDYSVMTNTTGNFTGLIPGSYIVYAKDPYSCLDSIIVTVDSEVTYGVLYRMEYDCQNGDVTIVDIEERDFAGSVTEVKGTDNPLVLRLRGEESDLFTPILSTEATIGLISETNFQFLDLFTQDDRKYRVRCYKNATEFWRGFIVPGLYQEQYYTTYNYYVNVEATDQIVLLKNLPFTDLNGSKIKGSNSLIKIIAFILSRTDLDLPIRSAVNIFETDMATTTSDDPLEQTHIDTETYYTGSDEPLDCYTVLQNILQSFGSRVYQWQGYWYIIPVDAYTNNIPYREFDVNGDYVSNGTFDPVFDIKQSTEVTRAAWANRTQSLEVRKAFGSSTITHKLVRYPESVLNGDFEDVDIETKIIRSPNNPNNSNTNQTTVKKDLIVQYNGWSLITNGNTASYYYTNFSAGNFKETANAADTNYAATIYSESDSSTFQSDAFILSKEQDITYSRTDVLVFKFDFFADAGNVKYDLQPPVIRFRWRLKLGTYYLQGDASWTTDTDFQWVDVFVGRDNFNQWQTVEIKAPCPDVDETTTTFQISLMHGSFMGGENTGSRLTAGGTWEINSPASLATIATVDLPLGYIIPVFTANNSSSPVNYVIDFYKLIEGKVSSDSGTVNNLPGYSPSSYYSIIVPSDYHATTNKKNWKSYDFRGFVYSDYNNSGTPKIAVRKFDNVSCELLPNNKKSPDTFDYVQGNDSKIKDLSEVEVLNGDVPNGITNAQNLYLNWYRYSDGTPTVVWSRTGVDELEPLLQLLAKRIIQLHNLPKFKLTGTLKTDTFFGFVNSLYENNSQKYFLPMAMTINDLDCLYDVELQEIPFVDNTTGGGVENQGAFDSQAFTNAFDI